MLLTENDSNLTLAKAQISFFNGLNIWMQLLAAKEFTIWHLNLNLQISKGIEMKALHFFSAITVVFILTGMASTGNATEEIGSVDIKRIQTPDNVETSIGTLKFIDGAPHPETAQKVYDYLDTMRGVDAFLKGIPAASVQGMMEGPRVLGQKNPTKFSSLKSSPTPIHFI